MKALDALGDAMIDQRAATPTSTRSIPPIFTYWSQFIDHELTARTDRDEKVSDITVDAPDLKPADRRKVERDLLNRRTPALELDCVYGDGPPGRHGDKARRAAGRNLELARKLRDGAKMRIGTAEVINRPDDDSASRQARCRRPRTTCNRDLPRIGTLLDLGVVKPDDFPKDLRDSPTFRQRAFIGDPRNDENLVVAQFHLALLRFHNAVVDWLRFKDPRRRKAGRGGAVRGRAQDRALDLPVADRQRLPQDAAAAGRRREGPRGRREALPEAAQGGETSRSCRWSSRWPATASATR